MLKAQLQAEVGVMFDTLGPRDPCDSWTELLYVWTYGQPVDEAIPCVSMAKARQDRLEAGTRFPGRRGGVEWVLEQFLIFLICGWTKSISHHLRNPEMMNPL